ncbi:MAG: glycosyltransferase family 4 protein [Ruminococcus sp.]|nr:glycosyltransferase family 4 protein [Candidatus Copronaster equi]
MKIGFYFNDKGFSNLDLKEPVNGNNGIGGTQYCFIMLADALIKYSDYDVVFYHHNENVLPDGVKSVIVSDTDDMLKKCSEDKIDFFVFKVDGVMGVLKHLHNVNFDCIAWAHNYIGDKELLEINSNQKIKRVVFVGKEQYDRYLDHDIIKKSTYIYNMFDGRVFKKRPMPDVPSVTYTGSLVETKGFHILANAWPSIIKAVPDAQLYVIGTGQLYDRNAKLGALGVADEKYEAKFADSLTINGKILDSVHFCGTMGKEKSEIYQKTTVGVMNPSGKTETFGLSAVEMEACGIPVVTKATNGLFDTVINEKTGYLIKNKRQLTQAIISLLKNREKNEELGKQSKAYADSMFLPENLVKKWDKMFIDIVDGKEANFEAPSGHYTNNLKWLRICIRKLKSKKIPAKSLIEIEYKIKRLIKG